MKNEQPVSYTHLDVYKRQGVRRRRAGPGVRRAGAARARGRRLAVFLRMNRTGAGRDVYKRLGPGRRGL